MTTDQFDIVDVHLHAWFNEPTALHHPHEAATVNEKVFENTLAQMDKLGALGVLSGPNDVTVEWCRRAPGRFIAAWFASPNPPDPDAEAARFVSAVDNQGFRALGELTMVYSGLPINDERFFPLYRVCQERQLPVSIHTGLNGSNPTQSGSPAFRVALGNPLLLEDVIAAFPKLKIIMCHMGYPFTEEATYMLHTHANVYMDVGVVDWYLRRAGFHRLLGQVVETVGPDKILFGSDQMAWPDKIAVAVNAIQEASFLSGEDKRKILGENARKLLGLPARAEPPPADMKQ